MDLGWSCISLASLVAGPVLFVRGFRALRVRQLVAETPLTRVRSLAMGFVELQGAVEPRSRVAAPFSGRPCAYWEVEVQVQRSRSREGPPSWATVHRARSGHPFYLRDDTGAVLVYPQGMECRTNFAVEEQTWGGGVPEPYASWMADEKLGMRHLWVLGPMRFRERTLEPGQAVFLLGRAFPRAQALAVTQDETPLAATGTDGGAAAGRLAEPPIAGVVRRGERDPIFMISQESQKQVAFEYGLKAFVSVFGGPAMTLFGLWGVMELIRSHDFIVH